MGKYIDFVKTNQTKSGYLMVILEAESKYDAEHKVLDLGYCGKHSYGVASCLSVDVDDPTDTTTDTFKGMLIRSETVSFNELKSIIASCNAQIKEEEKEEEREAIRKQIAELQEKLKNI